MGIVIVFDSTPNVHSMKAEKYSKPTFSIIIGVDGDNISVIVVLISCVVIQLV
jgi:hypothetical protein